MERAEQATQTTSLFLASKLWGSGKDKDCTQGMRAKLKSGERHRIQPQRLAKRVFKWMAGPANPYKPVSSPATKAQRPGLVPEVARLEFLKKATFR